jgi:hypothetical protein
VTGDVRQQLTEALDEIVSTAEVALGLEGASDDDRTAVEFMRRAAVRDLEMLDEHRDDRPGWQCACSPSPPCRELRRAAAFWLGTPEVKS